MNVGYGYKVEQMQYNHPSSEKPVYVRFYLTYFSIKKKKKKGKHISIISDLIIHWREWHSHTKHLHDESLLWLV